MTFRDLVAWQKAHALVLSIYRCSRAFPADETYGLRLQMRRAASSIPANIAEGHQRPGQKQFRQFLGVADGSLAELRYWLILAKDLGYLDAADYDAIDEAAGEVGRLIGGLLRSLGGE